MVRFSVQDALILSLTSKQTIANISMLVAQIKISLPLNVSRVAVICYLAIRLLFDVQYLI